MQQKLRFKRKYYGRGRTPSTREGWLCIIVFLIFIVRYTQHIDEQIISATNFVIKFVPIVITVGFLIAICYLKGEKPRQQWGGKPIKK